VLKVDTGSASVPVAETERAQAKLQD
jgi:hypothetical protein